MSTTFPARARPYTVPAFLRDDGPKAACHADDVDPDWFFPTTTDGIGRPPENDGPTAKARAICRGCPLREACADWAADTGEAWGVWGGLRPGELKARRLCRIGECEHPHHWRRA